MCLKDILFSVDKNGVGKGYKVYNVSEGELRFASSTDVEINEKQLLSGRWLYAENSDQLSYPEVIWRQKQSNYYLGFHLFTKLEDAVQWWTNTKVAIFEAEYKDVLAFGTQNNLSTLPMVVVSRFMRLTRQIPANELEAAGRRIFTDKIFDLRNPYNAD